MGLCAARISGCGCGLQVGAGLTISGSGTPGDPWIIADDGTTSPSSWTPTLTAATTNPTLGSGSAVRGQRVVVNGWAHFTLAIVFGTSGVNAGSGTYTVSRPYSAHGSYASFDTIGDGYIRTPAGTVHLVSLQVDGQLRFSASGNTVAHNIPSSFWVAESRIVLKGSYRPA